MRAFSSLVPIAIAGLSIAGSSLGSQTVDTIRVGSVRMARMTARVDTFDVDFETQGPSGPQRRQNVSVDRTTIEVRGKDSVVHMHFGPDNALPYWDAFVDPKTLATIQYEQHTALDSAVIAKKGDCLTGWVDLEKAPRRVVACDRFADRFAGSPVEERVIALIPLRPGQHSVLATYGMISGVPSGYEFSVIGQDTLTIRGKTYNAWRVEHRQTTEYGTIVVTTWVDRDRSRVLRYHREFPNNRRGTWTLRNP